MESMLNSLIFPLVFSPWTLLITLVILIWQWWKRPSSNFPPGPRGIPILNVYPYLGDFPQEVFRKWALKYGPVMSVRMGGVDYVFLNNYEAMKEALVTQSNAYSGRPGFPIVSEIIKNYGIMVRDYDDDFRTQKMFTIRTLKKLGMGRKEAETIINEESQRFVDFLRSKSGKAVYLGLDFFNVVGSIMFRLGFGKRVDYDDATMKNLFRVVQNEFANPREAKFFLVAVYFYKYLEPFLSLLGITKIVAHAERTIRDMLRPIIQHHRDNFNSNNCGDFIDFYLHEQRFGQGKTGASFSDRQLEVICRDFVVGGTESTTTVLSWMFLALLHNPDYHEKLLEEADTILDEGSEAGKVTAAHVKAMPLTNAFIEEVFRRFPLAPNSIVHKTQRDTLLFGYKIPKGTHVIPNIYAVHLDPKAWPDPLKFDPYRHINDEGKFYPSGKVVPFGMGARYCAGESLARIKIPIIFVQILQSFTITKSCEELPLLGDGTTSTIYSPKKYNMILTPR